MSTTGIDGAMLGLECAAIAAVQADSIGPAEGRFLINGPLNWLTNAMPTESSVQEQEVLRTASLRCLRYAMARPCMAEELFVAHDCEPRQDDVWQSFSLPFATPACPARRRCVIALSCAYTLFEGSPRGLRAPMRRGGDGWKDSARGKQSSH